jgi:hypothetical protein
MLLVIKRMAKEIWFTRLPVGHTHEDIDAIFGVIANAVFGKTIHTIAEYQKIIRQRFSKSGLKCSFQDVFVIPNYVSVMEDHIDPHLKNLHKMENTMLQWRFDAVVPSPGLFPNGVKTCYRAYSADKVTYSCHSNIILLIYFVIVGC